MIINLFFGDDFFRDIDVEGNIVDCFFDWFVLFCENVKFEEVLRVIEGIFFEVNEVNEFDNLLVVIIFIEFWRKVIVEVLCRIIIEDWFVVFFEVIEFDVNLFVLDSKIDDEWFLIVLGKVEFDFLFWIVDNDRLFFRIIEFGSRGIVCIVKFLDDISIEVWLIFFEGDIVNVLEIDWLRVCNFEFDIVVVCWVDFIIIFWVWMVVVIVVFEVGKVVVSVVFIVWILDLIDFVIVVLCFMVVVDCCVVLNIMFLFKVVGDIVVVRFEIVVDFLIDWLGSFVEELLVIMVWDNWFLLGIIFVIGDDICGNNDVLVEEILFDRFVIEEVVMVLYDLFDSVDVCCR